MAMNNQTPEQRARDRIDKQLTACGWLIQDKSRINLHAGIGVAVCSYPTDAGITDYALFVDGKPVGVIEAKREEEGHRLTVHEVQSEEYASAKLKYLNNEKLPFVCEITFEPQRDDINNFTPSGLRGGDDLFSIIITHLRCLMYVINSATKPEGLIFIEKRDGKNPEGMT